MEKIADDIFFAGLSGLQLPIPQKQFPPPFEKASRLTYYASIFNSIEFNSTFYKCPRSATVERWAASVGSAFKFTFKLWKEITHIKELNFKKADIITFLNAISSAGDKKGCLLVQFPPGLVNMHINRLYNLLNYIIDCGKNEWKIAIEFRNKSWYNDATYELLNSFNAAVVIHDIPKSSTPLFAHESDFIYIRFHGPTGNYRDSYSEDFLNEYASYINTWMKEGKEVYVYFNNTMGDAFNNLITLNRFLNIKVDETEIMY